MILTKNNSTPIKSFKQADIEEALVAGLDFIIRHQCDDVTNANNGRFAFIYDCLNEKVLKMTPNWVTGTAIEALLIGYRFTKNKKYLDSAARGIEYIKALQTFSHFGKFSYGGINETTAQCGYCHPRDALTAAWAMLDWYTETGDEECFKRAKIYADWYIKNAMFNGYTVNTVHFEKGFSEHQNTLASCQCGGGFFFYRLFKLTGNKKYKDILLQLVDFYKEHFLLDNGRPISLIDKNSLTPLLNKQKDLGGPLWEIMHVYNDDFAILANIAAYAVSNDEKYVSVIKNYFSFIKENQNKDGGFGEEEFSVPSAAGTCLVEILASKALSITNNEQQMIDNAINYILSRQFRKEGSPANGGILGVTTDYVVSNSFANMRTTSYSVMALLRYAGAVDSYYFIEN